MEMGGWQGFVQVRMGGSSAQMNIMRHLRVRMRAIRPAQRGRSFSVNWLLE